jgi:D-aminopeptidase
MGSGSGEVVLAFSTATHIPHYEAESVTSLPMLAEKEMNKLFKATVEAVEESVVSSLEHAQTLVGRNGNTARSLSEMLPFRTIDNSSLSK